MQFNIELSKTAAEQYEHILFHLTETRQKKETALLLKEFDNALDHLERMADSCDLCETPLLKTKGFRLFPFDNLPYLFVFRVKGRLVIIEGFYHKLQDCEHVLISTGASISSDRPVFPSR